MTVKHHPKRYVQMDPADLIPFEDNPRLNDDAVDDVANSIEDFSFNDPIEVNEDFVILSGHTRQKAALKLGLKEVDVIVISGMTEAEQMAYRIAANKTQEKAGWDFPKLDLQVDQLMEQDFDMSRYGLDLSYLDDRGMDFTEEEAEEQEEAYDGPVPREDEVWVRRGDMILLDSHRIMCGDSTTDDVQRLMDGATADIAFTSPPYNAGNVIGRPDREREGDKYIHEDLMDEDSYLSLLEKATDNMLASAHEVFVNIGVVSGSKRTVVRYLNRYIDSFKDLIYWQKSNPVPSVVKGVISSGTELIIALGRNSSRAFRKDIGIFYGVIQGTTVGYNPWREVHRAIFPEYLPREVIETFTDSGARVLDPFLGTGTTLIACSDSDRVCYGMDLEPLYVQIAVERWMHHVGAEDAVVIRGGEELRVSDLARR